jgi:hypothetical protein
MECARVKFVDFCLVYQSAVHASNDPTAEIYYIYSSVYFLFKHDVILMDGKIYKSH